MDQPVGDGLARDTAHFFYDEDDDAADGGANATRQALIDTQERMGMMLDIMPMGLLIHTRQGILFANREACRMLGANGEMLIGQHLLDFIAEADAGKVLFQIEASFTRDRDMQKQDALLVSRAGTRTDIKLISSLLPWKGTPVIQILLQDVSDLKRKELRLQRLSITDELTGAFNRRHVFREGMRQMRACQEAGQPLSAVMVDIDHFKSINDTHGHAAGDVALVEVTRVLSCIVAEATGDKAIFARLGGEEFIALLPGFGVGEANKLAEQLRIAAMDIRIEGPAGAFGMTVSLGVACQRPGDRQFDSLVSRADDALYAAKRAGRNCISQAA